jgi:hypothetical protein
LELAGDKPSCYVPWSQLDLTAASPLAAIVFEWSGVVPR